MVRPWHTIDRIETSEGTMSLMHQEGGDFIIRMEHYILMSSRYYLTEQALAQSTCAALSNTADPVILIGGLGMGYTLRSALDALPATAKVIVAELNPVVVDWCKGPLADLTNGASEDPRVEVRIADVAKEIARASGLSRRYDAILLDLYQGTHDANTDPGHPFYGRPALERTRAALEKGGALGVWTEDADVRFEKRLKVVGFDVKRTKPGKGGPRHIVYVAKKTDTQRKSSRPLRR
ncbi:MAG: spermidine synthase [bacterium]|nr:spermidine synthase [bacterium]